MATTFPADVSSRRAASSDDAAPSSIERRARRRVSLKLGFATHALVFALVNVGLAPPPRR